jgi:diguanylate cyclase (GGDEF)-like protein
MSEIRAPRPAGQPSAPEIGHAVGATILVVDDRPSTREFLVTLLGYAGYRTLEAADGKEALESVRRHRPDLVISDIAMPRMNGYQFVLNLRTDPALRQPRVVFLTGLHMEPEARALARACSVLDFVTKPVEPEAMLKVVRAALACPPLREFEPFALDAKSTTGKFVKLMASKLYDHVAQLEKLNAELDQRVAARTAELLVANASLEDEVARRSQAEEALRQANAQLAELAVRDALTGLYNRRYFEESLEREVSRAQRAGHPLGIVVIDIDQFKRCNDSLGHDAGDAVLRAVAATLQSLVRGEDILCRFGGEEFVLVMANASAEIARERAEQMRDSIQKLAIGHEGRDIGPVTVSAGVAMFPADGASGEAALKAADAALYRAKQSGRNRTVVCAEGRG